MKILTIIALTLIIGNIITKETTNANLKKNEIKTDKSSKKQIICEGLQHRVVLMTTTICGANSV